MREQGSESELRGWQSKVVQFVEKSIENLVRKVTDGIRKRGEGIIQE